MMNQMEKLFCSWIFVDIIEEYSQIFEKIDRRMRRLDAAKKNKLILEAENNLN